MLASDFGDVAEFVGALQTAQAEGGLVGPEFYGDDFCEVVAAEDGAVAEFFAFLAGDTLLIVF